MAVVTISRQFGAGGLTLGQMIAARTAFPLFDTEILQMVAEKARVSTDWVHSIEKEAGGRFQKLVSGLVSRSLVDRILDDQRGYIDEEIYVDLLRIIIRKIAEGDDAIIIGRGSQYILRDVPGVLSILLVADIGDRIRFISEKYKLSERQAKTVVVNEDKRRVNLYKKFGKEDFDHAGLYQLVINASRLNLENACDVVCRLVRQPS